MAASPTRPQALLEFAEGQQHDGESESESEGDDETQGASDSEEDESGDEGAAMAEAKSASRPATGKGTVLTMAVVKKWAKLVEARAASGVRLAIAGFQAACSFAGEGGEADGQGNHRFRIESAAVFNAVVQMAFTAVPAALDELLPVAAAKPGRGAALPSTSAKWKKLRGPVKVLLQGAMKLEAQLTDTDALCFVLQHLPGLSPYFACFPKLNREQFKAALHLWSHAGAQARLLAFLMIRRMAIVTPHPFIELALKGVYLTFIRNCKFPTPSVKPTLTFMLNCVVELYRLDAAASYQHAFVYIRQLAVHLRNAIVTKKKGAHLQVYNWQYVYALRVWGKLLGEVLSDPSQPETAATLKPLVYPLVQIVLGAVRLVPSSRYFPLRFHCLRLLAELMERSLVFIPLATEIFLPFESHELKARPRPSTEKPVTFDTELKVSKARLNSPQFQEAVVEQAMDVALQYYAAIACSIGFPEAVFPDTLRIRAILKAAKGRTVAKRLRPLLEKLEENAAYIATERAHVPFSPKDTAQVAKWEAQLAARGKSPLARHFKVHRSSTAEKSKLQAATQVVEGDDYEPATDSSDEGESDNEGTAGKRARGKDAHSAGSKKRSRTAAAPHANDEDEEDTVGDFSLKDFDFGDSDGE